MPPSRAGSQSRASSRSRGRSKTVESTTKRKRSVSAASSTDTSTSPTPAKLRPSRGPRAATVYDAVAGLITTHGFGYSASNTNPSRFRDTLSHSLKPLTPAEALSSARDAPEIFAEHNPYDLRRHLVATEEEAAGVKKWVRDTASRDNDKGEREDQDTLHSMIEDVRVGTLPDGDLLRSVHGFASRYYAVNGGRGDWRSLDETALLAIGVLLEEEVRYALGENGWRAFVEEDAEGEKVESDEEDEGPSAPKRRHKKAAVHHARALESSDDMSEPVLKRRKIEMGSTMIDAEKSRMSKKRRDHSDEDETMQLFDAEAMGIGSNEHSDDEDEENDDDSGGDLDSFIASEDSISQSPTSPREDLERDSSETESAGEDYIKEESPDGTSSEADPEGESEGESIGDIESGHVLSERTSTEVISPPRHPQSRESSEQSQ